MNDANLDNATHSGVEPTPTQAVEVRFSLRAPTGWVWWAVAGAYLIGLTAMGSFAMGMVALFCMPSGLEAKSLIQGGKALWLWVMGFVVAAALAIEGKHAKPADLDIAQWFQSTPVEAAVAVGMVLGALAIICWHGVWLLPKKR